MQEAYTFCYDVAVHFARRLLPETHAEDSAADFRLHMRIKAGSDERLALWHKEQPAYIVHCAHQFIIDRARQLDRHTQASLSRPVDGGEEPTDWDLIDNRIDLDDGLRRETHWRWLESLSDHLPKRSADLLRRRYRDSDSHAEIAAATGLSKDVVSQTISRALRALRAYCKEHGIDPTNLEEHSPPHVDVFLPRWCRERRYIIRKKTVRLPRNFCQDLAARIGI